MNELSMHRQRNEQMIELKKEFKRQDYENRNA